MLKKNRIYLVFLISLLFASTWNLSAQQKEFIPYTIKKGESLKQVARKLSLSTRYLQDLNPDIDKRPVAGTIIIIPNRDFKSPNILEYKVQEKETLYSISQMFDVSLDILKRNNPTIDVSNLPIGSILKVPQNLPPKKESKAEFHTVVNDDTLYSLSRKYQISQEKILELNFQIQGAILPLGEKLRISEGTESKKKPEKKFITHNVEKGNTLHSLKKQYQVTEEELIHYNPELKNGLLIGMELQIPQKKISYVSHQISEGDTHVSILKKYNITFDELVALNPSLSGELIPGNHIRVKDNSTVISLIFKENIDLRKKVKVAVLLPYGLSKLNNQNIKNNFDKNKLLKISTDYHMGTLIAIDSLQKKGVQLEVNFYDTENSKAKVETIANERKRDSIDLILGPLFYENAHLVSKIIPSSVVVAPFHSLRQEKMSSRNLVKTAQDPLILQKKLLNYLAEIHFNQNIVFINDTKLSTRKRVWDAVSLLRKKDTLLPLAVIRPVNNKIDRNHIESSLIKDKQNWIVILTDDKITTSAALNSLKVLSEEYPIKLFATHRASNFDDVDNLFLSSLNFTFPSFGFIDTTKANVLSFYKKFQKSFQTIPSEHAIRGFDITYDSIVRFLSAQNYDEAFLSGASFRLNAIFNYNYDFNGYWNKGVHLIQYNPDLSITYLDQRPD